MQPVISTANKGDWDHSLTVTQPYKERANLKEKAVCLMLTPFFTLLLNAQMTLLTLAQLLWPCWNRKHISPGSCLPLASTHIHMVMFCIFALHSFVFSWSNNCFMKGKLQPGASLAPCSICLKFYLFLESRQIGGTPPCFTYIGHYYGLCCKLNIDSL